MHSWHQYFIIILQATATTRPASIHADARIAAGLFGWQFTSRDESDTPADEHIAAPMSICSSNSSAAMLAFLTSSPGDVGAAGLNQIFTVFDAESRRVEFRCTELAASETQ